MSKDVAEVLREIAKVREARAYRSKKEAERLRLLRAAEAPAEESKPETLDAAWWLRQFGMAE